MYSIYNNIKHARKALLFVYWMVHMDPLMDRTMTGVVQAHNEQTPFQASKPAARAVRNYLKPTAKAKGALHH